jgi:hypothetical protein
METRHNAANFNKFLGLYLKRLWECPCCGDVCGRFGYSDLKEAALPEGARMGFLWCRLYLCESSEGFRVR